MQAAHNMKLCYANGPCRARPLHHLINRHGVSARILPVAAERAEFAARHADIGEIDMTVYIKKDLLPNLLLFDRVRCLAQG